MASRKRAKARKLRAGGWRTFWAAAFWLALVAALVASPFTQPVRVRISGVPKHDEARVERIVRTFMQRPSLLVESALLEAEIGRSPEVRVASFRSNVFGRARLVVDYRRPVAALGEKSAVDETGIVFPIGSRKPPNLQISQKVEDFSSILTISDASPLNRLARVAKKLQVSLPKLVGTLEIDDRERITLRIEDLVVEFGDTSSLDEKVKVLVSALQMDPQRADKGGSIILIDPENPVQVR